METVFLIRVEGRAPDRKEIEISNCYALATITKYTEMTEALSAVSQRMTANARTFIATIAYKARRHDPIMKRLGGEITRLSPAQISYLEELHQQYVLSIDTENAAKGVTEQLSFSKQDDIQRVAAADRTMINCR